MLTQTHIQTYIQVILCLSNAMPYIALDRQRSFGLTGAHDTRLTIRLHVCQPVAQSFNPAAIARLMWIHWKPGRSHFAYSCCSAVAYKSVSLKPRSRVRASRRVRHALIPCHCITYLQSASSVVRGAKTLSPPSVTTKQNEHR